MGCDWSWSGAWSCVKEGASFAVNWLKDNPSVVLAWAGAAAGCYATPPGCLAYLKMAASYTAEEAARDLAKHAESETGEYIEAKAREIFYKALQSAYEAIDELLDAGEITPREATRLKEGAARELGAALCPLEEKVKTQALWSTREIAADIYRERYRSADLKMLVDRALSEVVYRAPAVRESVSICPGFIDELRAELTRHFLRWGAAPSQAELPGGPPPPTVVELAGRSLTQQTYAVNMMRKYKRDWGNPKNVIANLERSGIIKPRSTRELAEHLRELDPYFGGTWRAKSTAASRKETLTGAAVIAVACGAAYWVARR